MATKILHNKDLTMISHHGPIEIDYYYYPYYEAVNNHSFAIKSLQTALQEAQSIKYIPLILKYNNVLHLAFLKSGDSLKSFHSSNNIMLSRIP